MHCGAFADELLQGIDRIAISPGVPLAEPFVQRAIARGIPVEGDIELLAQQLATNDYRRNTKVIAITGANGKTTVTSMVGAMCAAAGLDTQVAGNISPAVLDALRERDRQPQVWVLELSSFQLETTYTLDADAAVVLNVTEDHLDRYAGSMDAYAAAKARIFQGHGVQVLNRDDERSAAMKIAGRRQASFGLNPLASDNEWGITRDGAVTWLMQGAQKIMRADELQVSGLHNVANALAALALCRALGIAARPVAECIACFQRPAASRGKSRGDRGRNLLRRLQRHQRRCDRSGAEGLGQAGRGHPRRRRQGAGLLAAERGNRKACTRRSIDRTRCTTDRESDRRLRQAHIAGARHG